LKDPISTCIEKVGDELAEGLNQYITETMGRYPKLRVTVEEIVSNHLRECIKKCSDLLGLQIDLELVFMNTKHEDFIDLTR
jgi:hypothetical protein